MHGSCATCCRGVRSTSLARQLGTRMTLLDACGRTRRTDPCMRKIGQSLYLSPRVYITPVSQSCATGCWCTVLQPTLTVAASSGTASSYRSCRPDGFLDKPCPFRQFDARRAAESSSRQYSRAVRFIHNYSASRTLSAIRKRQI